MKFFSSIKYLYPIALGLILIGLISFSIFLYRHFYQTITQSQIISFLQTTVAKETVNKNLFLETIKKIENKKNQSDLKESDWKSIKNPFLPY